MGRDLQKRKNRSSIPKKRQKPKSKKQLLHNPIIAANWNSKETPAQNYRRLGLVSKLNKSTGGKERVGATLADSGDLQEPKDDSLAINPARKAEKPMTQEVTIERDEETGAIVKVIDPSQDNPLNDPLNELDNNAEHIDFNSLGRVPSKKRKGDRDTNVTRQLEEYALDGIRKRPREQSQREEEWIQRLVEKHGEDYRAMFWDKELNVYQQSEGDLKRRIKKWRQKNG